jgi:ubiquinone/menaquinone biosynthesis C-methylase UbiE
MLAKDRLATEQLFHDRQAQERAATFLREGALRFDDDWYLDHETWIRPAMDRLGDVTGLPVLDFGCGHGMAAVVLARRGAKVTAFDLSSGYLCEARQRAAANDVRIDFLQSDAERLPFADGSFARVWGNAILHHLDVRTAAAELRRVLQPGGIAVSCEPWGENPVLAWGRRRLPYQGKERTPEEQPLRRHHLCVLRNVFPSLEMQGYQLLSMARRILGSGQFVSGLDWFDQRLLRLAPGLSRFCRYVVLTLRRE